MSFAQQQRPSSLEQLPARIPEASPLPWVLADMSLPVSKSSATWRAAGLGNWLSSPPMSSHPTHRLQSNIDGSWYTSTPGPSLPGGRTLKYVHYTGAQAFLSRIKLFTFESLSQALMGAIQCQKFTYCWSKLSLPFQSLRCFFYTFELEIISICRHYHQALTSVKPKKFYCNKCLG